MSANVVIIHGPTGAGKSTLGRRLAAEGGRAFISSGDVLRRSGDSKLVGDLELGVLPEAEVVERYMNQAIDRVPSDCVIIFDGFPRRIPELQWLQLSLAQRQRKISKVLVLDVPPIVCLKRLTDRNRGGDVPTVQQRKLDWYKSITGKVIERLRAEGLVVDINANVTPAELYAAAEASL